MNRNVTVAVGIITALNMYGCAKSTGVGNAKKETVEHQAIDVSEFKNTESKEGAIKKSKQSEIVFTEVESSTSKFSSTGVGNALWSNTPSFSLLRDEVGIDTLDEKRLRGCREVETSVETFNGRRTEIIKEQCYVKMDVDTYQQCVVTNVNGIYLELDEDQCQLRIYDEQYVNRMSAMINNEEDSTDNEDENPNNPEGIGFGETHTENESDEGSSDYTEDPSGIVDILTKLFPDFGSEINDCDGAFGQFKKMYQGAQEQMNSVIAMAENPNQLSLTGITNGDKKPQQSLKISETDEKSALSYSFGSGEFDKNGYSITGGITLGANDNVVLLTQNFNLTFDQQKLYETMRADNPQIPADAFDDAETFVYNVNRNESFAIDLDKKLFEMTVDSGTYFDKDYLTLKGNIIVSAGDEIYIKQDLSLKNKFDQENTDMRFELHSRLENENKLVFEGVFTSDGQKGELGYTLTRNNGTCELSDMKNTLPDEK